MTRDEFYGNFLKYRKTKNEITHGIIGKKYYDKIDNYYKDGSAKYVWSEKEYNTWFKNRKAPTQKAKEGVENTKANSSGTAEYRSNFLKKAQAGKEAAIKNSEHNYKKIDAINWLHDYYEKLDERDRRLQGGSANAAKKEGQNYQKDVINPRLSSYKPGEERAAKEKENAEKAARRSTLLKQAQSGKENAIKNSETTVSDEEFERRVAKDKEYQRKNFLESQQAARNAEIKKAEPTAEEAQKRIDNLKAQEGNPVKKMVKSVVEKFDETVQKKMPIYGAMKKLQSDSKKIKNYVANNKEALEKELTETKKQKLDELNSNSSDFDRFLRKVKDDHDYRPNGELRSTPLYKALEQYMRDKDEDFTTISDYLSKGWSTSNRIKEIKEAYKELTRALEDEIDAMTIEQIAKNKI